MELFQERLISLLEKENFEIIFPKLRLDVEDIIEMVCYQALLNIKAVIGDNSLIDSQLFYEKRRNYLDFGKFGHRWRLSA